MKSKIIAVDLAKDVFEVAVANDKCRILERQRLSRKALSAFLAAQPPAQVLFEACGTAHFWGRSALALGHQVRLLPAQYTAPYRRRGKTDRTDVEALLEAHRCNDIKPVPVHSVEQQTLQQLHRVREQWKHTRTQRINGLRGFLRELGFAIPLGAKVAQRHARQIIDDTAIPTPLKVVFSRMLDELITLEADMAAVERQLNLLTKANADVQRLQTVAGVGLLTSTALVAAVGSPARFPDGKHLSSWLGLTSREHSSGNRRHLGKITKQGDTYLRTLLIHGARSVLTRIKTLQRAGKSLPRLYQWASTLEQRVGHNKAACALANKLARICWAIWTKQVDFNPNHVPA
jgi:transposase